MRWLCCLVLFCAALDGRAASYAVLADQIYARRPDGNLPADVYVPAGEGPFPGVIVIHGGGWANGERSDMRRVAEHLAASGFVAINITYRLLPAHRFPAQIHDCKAAVRWARVHARRLRLDPERLAAFGYSAGAHLALLLGTTGPGEGLEGVVSTISSRVQAVVAGSGPSDLRGYENSQLISQLLGGPEAGREQLYAAASPITHVSGDDAPTLLYHGLQDAVVRYEQSEAMAAALRLAGVPAKLIATPFGHVMSFVLDGTALRETVSFLRQTLRPQSQPEMVPLSTP